MTVVARTAVLLVCLLVASSGSSARPTGEADTPRTWYDGETGTVHLEWHREAGVTSYTVSRDGVQVAVLSPSQTHFVDARPTPGSVYEVQALASGDVAWTYQVLVVIPSEASDPETPRWFDRPDTVQAVWTTTSGSDCDAIYIVLWPPLAAMPAIYEECLPLVPWLPPILRGFDNGSDGTIDADTFLD